MDAFTNLIVISSVIVISVLLLGALLAVLSKGLGKAVTDVQYSVDEEKKSLNPTLTLGFEIPANSEYEEQLKQARILAAKKAAATPRGANLGIGSVGDAEQPTAFVGAKYDPITAVKIAKYHGWKGIQTGYVSETEDVTAIKAPSEEVAATKTVDDLVPGEDYPYIEITDDMSPAEKRKARIANAKAKSAAAKSLKEAAPSPETTPQQGSQTRVDTETKVVEAQAQIASGEPEAGVDYEVIEITDDMTPDDVRKARISNAKAKSAAMKAYRESGGTQVPAADQIQGGTPKTTITMSEEAGTGPAESQSDIPISIPKPNYIEITDDMDANEIRKARIQNAKEKSAYNKALKEAGIDPASVE